MYASSAQNKLKRNLRDQYQNNIDIYYLVYSRHFDSL